MKKYHELCDLINNYRMHYYINNVSLVSDKEFDELMKELRKMEKENPSLIHPDSPTQRVGSDLQEGFEKTQTRTFPMLSLGNVFSYEELSHWMSKLQGPFQIQNKIDGLSGSIVYENGVLVEVSTRGNGFVGDIVTQIAKACHNIPMTIPFEEKLEIRGEFYIPKFMLKRINEKRILSGEEPYKNCRNLASGTLKQHSPKVAMERGLEFIAFQMVGYEDEFSTETKAIQFMQSIGFTTVIIECHNIINKRIIQNFEEDRPISFDVDGAVIKVEDRKLQKELGWKGQDWNFAIAYKFEQEKAFTKLLDVKWQVGRGKITPVAILKPVELEGTTVKKATINNIAWIKKNDLRIGDTIELEKAGFIIPYINKVVLEERNGDEIIIEAPTHCPTCGDLTFLDELAPGMQLSCTNKTCDDVFRRSICYFIQSLRIEELSWGTITTLLNANLLKNFTDIFKLDIKTLENLNRMGRKSATKIYNNIQNARKQPLGYVIQSLGIKGIGAESSHKIAEKCITFQDFLNLSKDDIMTCEGLGNVAADNFNAWLQDSDNDVLRDEIEKFITIDNISQSNTSDSGSSSKPLMDTVFVITGKAIRSRDELTRLVIANGGTVANGVNKKTTNVIIGSEEDDTYKSNKKTKAIELGIPIWNEFKLFELVGYEVEEEIKIKTKKSLKDLFNK